jgi:hypothetical protein
MIGIFFLFTFRDCRCAVWARVFPAGPPVDTVVVVVVVVTTLVVGGDSVGVHLGLSVLKFINKC